MSKNRVVITGLGIVSCFGDDVPSFYRALLDGQSGVTTVDSLKELSTRIAAPVAPFSVEGYIDRKQNRRIDPFIRYALVAGKKALQMAQCDLAHLDFLDKTRCGVIVGSGMGGMNTFYEGALILANQGYKKLSPFFVPYIITNMAGALLAIDLGFMGPNYSISTACATANYSIVAAAKHIQEGEADLMLCGGSEAAVSPIGLAGFIASKALSENNEDPQGASRPWDQKRDGFVLGEGCGILVLERLEHALARKAPIFAEYLGGSITCDAYHMTALKEDGSGIALCMHKALENAGLRTEDVDYINAHATSTPQGDMVEIRAIQSVFGNSAERVAINATKSMTGHCLGAAGAVEAIATVMSIQTGWVHPTTNLTTPEPGIQHMNVFGEAREMKVRVGMSNSFGFGGHNSVVVLGEYRK